MTIFLGFEMNLFKCVRKNILKESAKRNESYDLIFYRGKSSYLVDNNYYCDEIFSMPTAKSIGNETLLEPVIRTIV